MNAWDDPRIARGMQRQLAERRARIAAGEKPLGWKVGLGAKPAMDRLNIKMPLVGYVMQKSQARQRQHGVGRGLDAAGRGAGGRVHMAADLPRGADRAATVAAIGALGRPSSLPISSASGGCGGHACRQYFHRHVILGPRIVRAPAHGSTA